MINPVVASPQISHSVVASASVTAVNSWHKLYFWWHSSGWAEKSSRFAREHFHIGGTAPQQGWDGKGAPERPVPKPEPQETQEQRNARIVRVELFPKEAKIRTDEPLLLNAVAFDKDDNPVGGVNFNWSAFDEDRGRNVSMAAKGKFVATMEGRHEVRVEVAGRQAAVKVRVEGRGRKPDDRPIGPAIPVSTHFVPKADSSGKIGSLSPRDNRRRRSGLSGGVVDTGSTGIIRDRAKRASGASGFNFAPAGKMLSPLASVTGLFQSGGEDPYGWNTSNWWSADDPGNGRGDPIGEMKDDGAGSGNFQFSVPGVALDGRGLDVSLDFHYNSRVWHRPSQSSSQITFDIDHDWPAVGWSLGFGKIIGMGAQNGYMLVDPDGTRHGYTGTLTIYPLYQTFDGYTTDGSFIDLDVTGYNAANGGAPQTGFAYFPNGMLILYGAAGSNAIYPVYIEDANGNMIHISYRNNQGPQIETITDTLGRLIQFHYDSNNLLTAITAPGFTDSQGGSTPRQVIRLHYHNHPLDAPNNYGFSGLTPVVQSSTAPVIDAIFYPGTSAGYWFGDSDSYSSYGMLNKIIEQRGMSFTDQGLTSQGIITQGSIRASGSSTTR